MDLKNLKLAIIGLGYVGLPLAVEFGKKRRVTAYDINKVRINELKNSIDRNNEITSQEIKESAGLHFSNSEEDLTTANCYIVTVPTPIDENKRPDLSTLLNACKLVGKYLKKNDLVIFESTVFPGATEEECVPVLEESSGLIFNSEFFCGYSPERINPGDSEHRLPKIIKITSGSSQKSAKIVDSLYREIIIAGTYRVENLKIAEAAKVIENTQRDLNIALINELAKIFDKLDIDTEAVINAANTKWNFIRFNPGLVGGHCIGVDPYYLTHKARELGYNPEIILAGRKLNDGMGSYAAKQILKYMSKKNIRIDGAKILIMGLTFKENCKDLRNTRVIDIVHELMDFNCEVDVFEPLVELEEAKSECKIDIVSNLMPNTYDGIIIAVGHDRFKQMGVKEIRKLGRSKHVLYDLKYVFKTEETDLRL